MGTRKLSLQHACNINLIWGFFYLIFFFFCGYIVMSVHVTIYMDLETYRPHKDNQCYKARLV